MITRIILKLSEGDSSRSLLKRILKETTIFEYEYNIFRRPVHAYEKESFDGLLEIVCHNKFDSFHVKLIELICDLKASIKVLVINPNEIPKVLCFSEGALKESITDASNPNQIMDECLYYGDNLAFNFYDVPLFIESKDYIEVFEIFYKYAFIHLEFNSHSVYFKPWFFLPKERAEVFMNDLKHIANILYKHNIFFNVNLIGFDSQLSLQNLNISYEKTMMTS